MPDCERIAEQNPVLKILVPWVGGFKKHFLSKSWIGWKYVASDKITYLFQWDEALTC